MQCMNDIMLMERISHEFDEKPHKSFYAKQSSYGAKVINAALHPLNLQTVLAGETLAYTNLLQEFVTSCRYDIHTHRSILVVYVNNTFRLLDIHCDLWIWTPWLNRAWVEALCKINHSVHKQ